MQAFKEFLIEIFIPSFFVMSLAAAFAFGLAYAANSYSCIDYNKQTGLETKFSFSGCYVKIDGNWFDTESIKVEMK